MNKYFHISVTLFCIFVSLIFSGCSETSELVAQRLTGTYSGQSPDGDTMILTVEQKDQGVRGNGAINGSTVVISGILTWEAIGSLSRADGSSSLIRISWSPNSGELTIKETGRPDVDLLPGGTPVTGSSGPFSGRYRTASPNDSLASADIIQTGTLISGIARYFDQNTAISGQVMDSNKAIGVLTFSDESRVQFNAELSADQQSITITGMGNPVLLERF